MNQVSSSVAHVISHMTSSVAHVISRVTGNVAHVISHVTGSVAHVISHVTGSVVHVISHVTGSPSARVYPSSLQMTEAATVSTEVEQIVPQTSFTLTSTLPSHGTAPPTSRTANGIASAEKSMIKKRNIIKRRNLSLHILYLVIPQTVAT